MDLLTDSQTQFLCVTGMSGAGKTLALKILAEMNYHICDNIPIELLPDLVKHDQKHHIFKRAIGVGGALSPHHIQEMLRIFEDFEKKNNLHVNILFLDAKDSILSGRFAQTGLTHPLGVRDTLEDNLIAERHLLRPLYERADRVLDTSDVNPRQLMRMMQDLFMKTDNKKPNILISSFGFKYNPPRSADMLFDARLLANPHWHESLRGLTGKDQAVQDFLKQDPKTHAFMQHMIDYIRFVIIENHASDKPFYHIAVGCTGGKHRSVYCVEKLKDFFSSHDYDCHVFHRTISYDGASKLQEITHERRAD